MVCHGAESALVPAQKQMDFTHTTCGDAKKKVRMGTEEQPQDWTQQTMEQANQTCICGEACTLFSAQERQYLHHVALYFVSYIQSTISETLMNITCREREKASEVLSF